MLYVIYFAGSGARSMVTSLAFLGVVAEKARLHEGICSARRDPHVQGGEGIPGKPGAVDFLA